jgi:hypothetical protein
MNQDNATTLAAYDKTESSAHPLTTIQWRGYLDSIDPEARLGGGHLAKLRALGPLSIVRDKTVNVQIQTNYQTGAAVGKILDGVDWPVGDRLIDAGNSIMSYWFTSGKVNALNALQDVEETEAGFLREMKDGKIAFEGRNHRNAGSHILSQCYFSDAATAWYPYSAISQSDFLKTIYNVIEADVKDYTVGALAVLWVLSDLATSPLAIAAAGSVSVWAKYPTQASSYSAIAVDAWTTPVATTDFLANSLPTGTGTNLTADITVAVSKFDTSMKITLTNGGASLAYITFLQARGTPIAALDAVKVTRENTVSQGKYGLRTYPVPAKFLSDAEAAGRYCDLILAAYKDPAPVITMSYLANISNATLNEALTRDISDRVTLCATGNSKIGADQDFFVESINHSLKIKEHRVTYQLSPAAAAVAVWELGTDELGIGSILGTAW